MKAILMVAALLLAACISDEPQTCGDCHSDCGVLRDSCHEACNVGVCADAGVDGGEQMEEDGWT
jgi:hypothetical protein